MKRSGQTVVVAWVTLALGLPGGGAWAAAPSSVRDLVGARAAGGESALESRGFAQQQVMTRDGGKRSYWWNASSRECIQVDTQDGRYEQIDQATRSDCHQSSSDSSDKTAAVVVGAAALLGIAALASKSSQRGDRYNDRESTADYERGYRDGLYNQSYHNYSRSNAYSDGYTAGVEQRGHETRYRSGHEYRGGYSSAVYVGDLRGETRDDATSRLLSRGFVIRDDRRTESGRYRTFWHGSARQCLMMVVDDGRVRSVDPVSNSTCRD